LTAAVAQTPRPVVFGWSVVGLLALCIFINYVDRGNLATAAPLIKDEMKLTHTQMGWLLSCFFWTYVAGQPLVGWLQEKINAYRTLALGLLVWSIATAATGLATGFFGLIALRLVMGLGESVAFPCSSKLIGARLPEHRFGAANGMITLGLALGPAFGTFAGGMVMAQVGWRWLFILFGLASSLWLIPWFLATRRLSQQDDTPTVDTGVAPAFAAILKRRDLWGVSLGHFALNYAFYFVISWLPTYLIKARGLSVTEMAQLGGLIYLVYAASCLGTGWLSDRWLRAGASATKVRKTFSIIGAIATAGGMTLCAVGDAPVAITGLFVAAVATGLGAPMLYCIGQTLAGPRAAGKWMSLQNCLGNLAGIFAPLITGWIVDVTGSFVSAFALAAGVSLLGVIAFGFVVRKIAPLTWEKTA
jgi:MFS family permease